MRARPLRQMSAWGTLFANSGGTHHPSSVQIRHLSHRSGWVLGLSVLMAAACSTEASDNKPTPPPACSATAPTQCPTPPPSYADVAPVFERRCASCHNGSADAPWPLDTYDHVADWASVIRDELLRCSMPPPDSGVTMSSEERELILTWIYCGYPE